MILLYIVFSLKFHLFPKFLIEFNMHSSCVISVGSEADECAPCEACEPCLPCIALPGADTGSSTPAPGPPPGGEDSDDEDDGDTDSSHRLSATLAILFVGAAMLL